MTEPYASVGPFARVPATFIVSAASASSATTRVTRPQSRASRASIRRFVSMSSWARRRPMMRGRNQVELLSGDSPAAVNAIANPADSPAIT